MDPMRTQSGDVENDRPLLPQPAPEQRERVPEQHERVPEQRERVPEQRDPTLGLKRCWNIFILCAIGLWMLGFIFLIPCSQKCSTVPPLDKDCSDYCRFAVIYLIVVNALPVIGFGLLSFFMIFATCICTTN